MLSSSSISIMLLLAEISIVLGAVIFCVQKKLKDSRQQTKDLTEILQEERSSRKFREKLKDYFEQEIKRTHKRHEELLAGNDNDKIQRELLLTRKNALDVEKKASQKSPLDLDYWNNVQQGYSGIFPNPSSPAPAQANSASGDKEAVATASGKNPVPAELSVNKAATEELSRLRNVINNQYASIDALKRQMLDIEEDELLANHSAILDLQNNISRLVAEQEQMAMCVQVLEAENERLQLSLAQLPQLQAQGAGEAHHELKDNSLIAQELKRAESLIQDLMRTNKEQLGCITTLESELEMKHDLELNSDQTALVESVRNARREIKQLNLEKLQNLATIDQLQAQLQNLRDNVTVSPTNSNTENKELEKQLHAKTAELNLLREDYQRMHQKYIKLYQDKAS